VSSRLFQEVRERRGLAYSIDAGEAAYADAGTVTIEWGCAPDKVPEITGIVRDEIFRIIEFGVSDAELARARGQLAGQLLLADEGASARMGRIGTGELLGDRRDLDEILRGYRQVTAEEVRRSAAETLSQPPVLAVVGGRVSRPKLSRVLENWQ
jgi:predicted Zn-dependent peptidase